MTNFLNSTDPFGDRMKFFEQAEAGRKLMPLLPVCIRLDGKGFHKYTSDLDRPFDNRLHNIMVIVTKYLVKETNAKIGYTQSDEISLIIHSENFESEIWFDGKIQKINSVLASMASVVFNQLADGNLPSKDNKELDEWLGTADKRPSRPLAFFDCRTWNVPNKSEAANSLLWREHDASKNSISMATRHYYSHKEMMNKSCAEMHEMLHKKGVNWNDYPTHFKRGTFVKRKVVERVLTQEIIDAMPEKNRPTGEQKFIRTVIEEFPMPIFSKVANREGVIFDNEEIVLKTEGLTTEERFSNHLKYASNVVKNGHHGNK